MSGGDGTGPFGHGAMTGRGRGFCAGGRAIQPGAGLRMGSRLGLACRRGSRNGFGRGFDYHYDSAEPQSAETVKERLQNQKDFLQSRLENIEKQLDELQ